MDWHPVDYTKAEDALLVNGALLMVFGVGSIIGPTAGEILIGIVGARGLFSTAALLSHILLANYALWRMSRRRCVIVADKNRSRAQVRSSSASPKNCLQNHQRQSVGQRRS